MLIPDLKTCLHNCVRMQCAVHILTQLCEHLHKALEDCMC